MQEQWMPVKNYEGLYEVSSLGRVKALPCNKQGKSPLGKIMKDFSNGKNYRYLALAKDNKRKNHYVHRLVAEAFLINEEGKPHINHKNGIKDDNRLENLEWATLSENMTHAVQMGLLSNPNAKLRKDEVVVLRKMFDAGYHRPTLAKMFNISKANVHRIGHRQMWKAI